MEVTNALKRLRDDLKEWTTNNILSLKTYVDKTKFSGSYNDLTNKPDIPSIEGLATEEFVSQQITELRDEMVILEEDDLTMDGLIDNTFPGLTTEDKTLLGAINEINSKTDDGISREEMNEILMEMFGITLDEEGE